jgi:putative DNA primase/helicase
MATTSTAVPPTAPVVYDVVPDDLKELDQWVLWRYEGDDHGRATKVPYQRNGRKASSSDQKTWCSFEDARAVYETGGYSGLGFVFAPDGGLVGIDLDDCLTDSGAYEPWAIPIIQRFHDSYSEVSPSGLGIKIFARGKLPGGGTAFPMGDGRVELYDQGRYFTVTGDVLDGTLPEVEEHQSDIDWLLALSPHGQRKVPFVIPARIAKGTQYDSLFSLAGSNRARGCEFAEILALLRETNKRLEEPAPESHLRRIAENVCRFAPGTKYTGHRTGVADLIPFHHNDHGNACRLAAMYGDELRYCHAMKRWFVWDGMRWAVDDTGRSRHMAKQTMLEYFRQASEKQDKAAESFARVSLNSKGVTAALTMAESDLYFRPEDMDQDPWLLNFMNGTVDLRTGVLKPHDQNDYITKLIHHAYKPEAQCPRWLAFLNEIMAGSAELVSYLQRAFGYSLTGTTSEKAVFVPFGPSNSGKSTTLTTFRTLISEYSSLLMVDTLMTRRESNNSQADLADLRGARFVQTSESEEGQRLAQGKLKVITTGMGGIKAVRKYENPFEFAETHKLWLDTNFKPTIGNGDDQATFNRLHPIPFAVAIPNERIDRDLPEKLLAEAEGILAWAVAGARLWHRHGLQKPGAVQSARNEWQAESDQVRSFLDDCCTTREDYYTKAKTIYEAYKKWAEDGGEKVITATMFGRKLTEKGFPKTRRGSGNIYSGVRVDVGCV